MKFKGDIIITDPCYIIREDSHDDWGKCNYGKHMNTLGINTYLTRDTIYGDWSCTTFNSDTKEVLGRFCADAGLVSVFLLDEVLKYNPNFDYYTNRTWTTTIIKDFDGEVNIEDEDYMEQSDEEVRVIGKGNVNFYTTQTGL